MTAASTQLMPAGTQFDDHAQIPATAAAALLASPAEHDGVQVQLAGTSRTVGYNVISTTHVRSRTGDGAWKTAALDNGKRWRKPAGFPSARGAYPVGVIAGAGGFVATVGRYSWDSASSYQVAQAGQVWSSPDGHSRSRMKPPKN